MKRRVLSHVAMKVTSKKKKRARTSSGGRRRVRDEGRGSSKIRGMRSVGKRHGTPMRVGSGRARDEERRKAKQRKVEEGRTPGAAVKASTGPVSSVPVPGREPESRGAPPPLPTPIATFNI